MVETLNQPLTMDSSDPPFEEAYKDLIFKKSRAASTAEITTTGDDVLLSSFADATAVEECDLPIIDIGRLEPGRTVAEQEECKQEITRASQEWGFFQVVNHGISPEILKRMRKEQEKVFKQPFEKKRREDKFLNFSAGSYRWGTPSATCLKQLSWSEAFHVPLSDVYGSACGRSDTSLSSMMEQFASTASNLAQQLAEILAEKLGHKSTFFLENCLPSTCYLRMNRYPPCPVSSDVYGLMPHTDSDFLTILHQDEVGGLQLVKDGRWISVKPNPDALIINIGDLFQAWSNDVYKSVHHRVVSNPKRERFSIAYFLCPSYDTVIKSCSEPSVYKSFSFQEFREQVQQDVRTFGHKVGLPRFLA